MDWKAVLNIKDVFQAGKRGEATVQQVAADIAARAKHLPGYDDDYDLQGIIEQMEDIAESPEATADDFDYVFDELYDWADAPIGPGAKRCWIATF